MNSGMVRVWDPLVRSGHWLLAIAFVVAYVTEGEPLVVHTWAGYLIAAIVVVRVIWGVVGPRRARFSDFVYAPAAVFAYLAGLARGTSKRYIGHSPAGGAMTVALLLFLAATTFTGMMTLADTRNAGPLAPWLGNEQVAGEMAAAEARGERFRYRSPYKEPHELFVNITLLLVLFHIAGVALASYAHRENLPRAMMTGMKRAE